MKMEAEKRKQSGKRGKKLKVWRTPRMILARNRIDGRA